MSMRLARELKRLARLVRYMDYTKTASDYDYTDRLKEVVSPDVRNFEGDSHDEDWHHCSVLGHIKWTRRNAIAAYKASGIDVREIAALHDIGKVIGMQVKPNGDFTFKGHEISGAEYLRNEREWHTLTDGDIEVIETHGSLRKGVDKIRLTEQGLKKLVVLELCDEFSKWSEERLPPMGDMEKLENQRSKVIDGAKKVLGNALVDKIVAAFSECV